MSTPHHSLTLSSILPGLLQPFAPEQVKFLPKSPRRKSDGQWTCLACPYADKRAYEDRLNLLAPDAWSTPYVAPIVAGNKLVIPVTVVIYGIARTDYGEAFLSSQTRDGETREEENSATEGYSQGFRRACAQFGLGRYFYDLPKLWLPYDAKERCIALSETEKMETVSRLYHKGGLTVVAFTSIATSSGNGKAQPSIAGANTSDTSAVEGKQDATLPQQRQSAHEAGRKATPQQYARITKGCELLGKAVPDLSDLSTDAADALIQQLIKEYREQQEAQASGQAGSTSLSREAMVQPQHINWITGYYCRHHHTTVQEVCQRFGVTAISQLRSSQYNMLVNETMKDTRSGQEGKAS